MKKYIYLFSTSTIAIGLVFSVFVNTDSLYSKAEAKQETFDKSTNSYLVKVKRPEQKEKFRNIKRNRSKLNNFKKKRELDKWIEVNINNEQEFNKIKNDPDVTNVVKNGTRRLLLDPNDPYYASTGSYAASVSDQWNMRQIGLVPVEDPSADESGWEKWTGSTETIVAVIDTGIDLTHPDLSANIWVNSGEIAGNTIDDDDNDFVDDRNGYDFANNDSNPQDINGHGTHVSGIVAAVTDNSVGVAGVCWTCKVMPLRVINDEGFGFDSDIVTAIHYATDEGAQVINMSLGGPGFSQILQDGIDYAASNGVLVVSAAGNDSASASDSYPGGAANTLSIGAINNNNLVPSYSNTGPRVDLVAPGGDSSVEVLSTKPQSISVGVCPSITNYACLHGTSMASPHVAGVGALLFDLHKDDVTPWNAKQVRASILQNVTDLGSAGFDNSFGYGRVNASYDAINASVPSADSTSPTASLTTPSPSRVKGNFAVTGTATDANLYIYTISLIRNSNSNVVSQFSGRSNVISNTLYTFNTASFVDGDYTLTMRVEDFMGNETNSNSIQITIDNTAPASFSLTSPSNGSATTDRTPTLNWTAATDASNDVKYDVYLNGSIQASNLSSTTYTFPSNISEAQHSWYVIAKDSVDNARTSSTSVMKVDATPPNDFIVNTSADGSNITFTFSTTDSVSALHKYDISIDGATTTNVSSPHTVTLSDGNHTAIVTAFDWAGNTKISSKSFTVDARTPYLKSKADFNISGKVDLSDLSILAQNWLQSTSNGDANGDGKVDLSDLSILAQNWNQNF